MESSARDEVSLFAARRALAEGENFTAYDLAEAVPDGPAGPSIGKIHVMALALARSGAIVRARELADALPDGDDTEVMGLKSRLWKDIAQAESDPVKRREAYAAAADVSERIFLARRNWYNGVNAASCRFLAGEREKARKLVAEMVLPLCERENQRDMWLVATLGECHLLLGNFPEATEFYRETMEIAEKSHRFGDFASTIRQIKMLASEIGPAAISVLAGIDLPCVAVFSGHMIDAPERPEPRFPLSAENYVRCEIRKIVRKRRVAFGYASCACGGDVLFLEEVLSAGGRVVVVPSLPLETTIRNSVAFAPGNWESRLSAILNNPGARVLDSECDETGEHDELAYDFCNKYVFGMAKLKAQELAFPLRGVCVWNGKKSGLAGGTDSAVEMWTEAGLPIDAVDPLEGAKP